jgi:hypothetical protein
MKQQTTAPVPPQRIEKFEGLAILTTNLKSNIDTAFLPHASGPGVWPVGWV